MDVGSSDFKSCDLHGADTVFHNYFTRQAFEEDMVKMVRRSSALSAAGYQEVCHQVHTVAFFCFCAVLKDQRICVLCRMP